MKTKKEIIYDIKVSLFVCILALVYLLLVKIGIPWNGKLLPGIALKPTLFPKIVSYLFLATAACMMGKATINYWNWKKKTSGINIEENIKTDFKIEHFPLKEFIPVLTFFVIYLLIIEHVGFIISTIMLSLAWIFYVNKNKPVRNIIFSVVFPVVVYLLFEKVLTIYLPKGFLGFI